MTIRQATLKDVDEILALGKHVPEFDTTDQTITFWAKPVLINCIESKSDWLFVAEEDSEIIGFIICNHSPVFKKAVIENIFVSPKHRRKGIGKSLLSTLMRQIMSTDCEYVVIFSREDNHNAIDFSLKNGFTKGKNFVWIDKVLSNRLQK